MLQRQEQQQEHACCSGSIGCVGRCSDSISSVAASGSVTGALQGQDQERCSVQELETFQGQDQEPDTFLQHFCNIFAICLLHFCNSFATLLQHVCYIVATCLQHCCNIFATFVQHACYMFASFLQHFCNYSVQERCRSVAGTGSGALQRLGALQECCRGRIRSVAASGSVTGALQGQDQVSGARFETLSRYQDRARGRICDVARVC